MSESFKCRVSRVDTSTEALNPVIVEFQNGCVRPEAAKRLECGVYEHKKTKRRHIAVADGSSSYLGQELHEECCQTFLAIRNRKSNEVRLVAASKALLLPVLDQDDNNAHTIKGDYKTKMMDLARAFGSKKDRRAAEQIEKMSLNVNAVMDTLNESANMVSVSEINYSSLPEDGFLMGLPHCNRDANIATEIYKMTDLVGEDELLELSEEAGRIIEAGESEITTKGNYPYSALFKFLFKPILTEMTQKSRLRNVACLLYMEFIIQLIKTHFKQFARPDFELCSASPVTNKAIMSKFTNKRSRGCAMPSEKQDLAICYITLIGLLLSVNQKIPLDVLTEAMHCKSQRLIVLCQAIGVTIQQEKNFKVAVLSLPLPNTKQHMTLKDYMTKQKVKGSNKAKQ